MKLRFAIVAMVAAMGTPAAASDAATASPETQLEIARRLAPSLVRVEFTLEYDHAEAPEMSGFTQRCPNCGRYHGSSDGEQLVLDERPAVIGGFLIDATHVVIADPMVQPRFVKSIRVRFEDQSVEASLSAVARDRRAVILELAGPLEGAEPLHFDSDRSAPYLAVTHGRANGSWMTAVLPVPIRVTTSETGRAFIAAPSASLIVDNTGAPVGLNMNDQLDLNAGWKGSPAKWAVYTTEDLKTRYAKMDRRAGAMLPRVHLSFRSPKKRAGQDEYSYRGGRGWDSDEDDPTALERNVPGIVLDTGQVLVLTQLSSDVTARLERISIHPVDSDPVDARFVGSLEDFGCFVAAPASDSPAPAKGLAVSDLDLRLLDQTYLPAIQLRLHGEQRVSHLWHERLTGLDVGWKGRLYPTIAGDESNLFIFGPDGALLAFPISRREDLDEAASWRAEGARLTPAHYVTRLLDDLSEHIDPSNAPLTAEEEDRLAWLGVELQALNRDLARANGVAHLTEDGEMGALVSYVHSGSPAQTCGLEQGDILLRLHVDDRQAPIPVTLDPYGHRMMPPFPWEHLDQVPLEYFDELPQPWPPARTEFRETLTNLGFGEEYTIELSRGGKVLEKRASVDQTPPHYDTGHQFKFERLGLTVRDLTFEVRLYFQKRSDSPGVIVSKVEPGGKAAVAGIKPFEIITHVNDTSVAGASEFEALVEQQSELRVSIDRKGRGRLVHISLPNAKAP